LWRCLNIHNTQYNAQLQPTAPIMFFWNKRLTMTTPSSGHESRRRLALQQVLRRPRIQIVTIE
jgi:hypothetical protein